MANELQATLLRQRARSQLGLSSNHSFGEILERSVQLKLVIQVQPQWNHLEVNQNKRRAIHSRNNSLCPSQIQQI